MAKVFDIAFKLGAELAGSFKSAFVQADGLMSKLGAAATAVGAGAALGGAITQVVDMENSIAKLAAQTGTYGSNIAELGDVAKTVFKAGHGESFDDVTMALGEVKNNLQGLDNGELARVTGDAMQLADTFDSDVNWVTRAANNLMTNFGMDSTKAFDMMAKGAQEGLNFSGEMFDNLSEYSPLWADMGYSAEDMFGIMKNGAKEGVYNLDYLNDVMKEFQIRATDGSKSTLEAVSALSPETQKVWQAFSDGKASVADMSQAAVADLAKIDDKVKQNELGVALFGTKWEDLGGDVVLSMLAAGESLEDFDGAMQKINEVRFDTVGAALKGIGRILLVDLVVPIGEAVLPALNMVANFLRDNLPGAIEKTASVLGKLAPILAGVAASMLMYRTIIFSMAASKLILNAVMLASIPLYTAYRAAMIASALAGGGLRGVLAGLAVAMRVLTASMFANPIVLLVSALVGLGVAFYVAYKRSETFRNAVNNAFSAVVGFVSQATAYVASAASSIWSGLVSGAGNIGGIISSAFSGIGSLIASVLGSELAGKASTVVSGFIETLKVGFSSLPGILSLIAPTIATLGLAFLGVSGPVAIVVAAVVSLVGFLYRLSQTNSTVAIAFASAWQAVQTAFAPLIQTFSTEIARFSAEVGPQLQQTMAVISQSIATLAPVFGQLISTIGQAATMMIPLWAQVATTILNLAAMVLPMLLQVVASVFPMILSVIQMVLPFVISLLLTIVPIILQIAQMILPMLLQAAMMVFPMILSIVQLVLPFIVSLLSAIIPIVLQIVSTVLPMLLQVVMMVFPMVLSIIQMVIPFVISLLQMLIPIITGVLIPAINSILAVVQLVFPLVMTIIQTAMTIINGIITAAMALLQGDWNGAWNAIKGTAETIMNSIISFFEGINLYDVGVSIINGLINGIKSMGSAIGSAISSLIPAPLKSAVSGVIGAIPGFAKGGVVSSPTLAWIGEGGDTETIIPHNNAARSKQLWVGAGQALGMFDKMQPQSTMPRATSIKASDVGTSSAKTLVLEDKRQFHFSGGNPEEIREQIAISDEELLRRIKQLLHDEGRLEFG